MRIFGRFCIILANLSQIYKLFDVLLQAIIMWWYIKIDKYQVCIFLTRLPNFFSVIAVVWLISEICQSISCSGRHQKWTTSAWCEVVKLRGHDGRRATNTNKKNLCSHWDDPPSPPPLFPLVVVTDERQSTRTHSTTGEGKRDTWW